MHIMSNFNIAIINKYCYLTRITSKHFPANLVETSCECLIYFGVEISHIGHGLFYIYFLFSQQLQIEWTGLEEHDSPGPTLGLNITIYIASTVLGPNLLFTVG